MTDENDKYSKVLFRYHSEVLDETVVETMWAIKIDELNGIYKLDSIPFYGPLIATEDHFFAEFDESEQMLTYRKTVKSSGNSIILVSISNDNYDINYLRDTFKQLDCTAEGLNNSFFSMEILATSNYWVIKQKLERLKMMESLNTRNLVYQKNIEMRYNN